MALIDFTRKQLISIKDAMRNQRKAFENEKGEVIWGSERVCGHIDNITDKIDLILKYKLK